MSKIRLVIFDIGGTIIEDHGEVVASFCAALAANGLPASEAEIRGLKGSSKRDVIKRFVERQWGKEDAGNEGRIREAYGDFRTELENRFSNGGVKPILGAESAFAWLKASVITSKPANGDQVKTGQRERPGQSCFTPPNPLAASLFLCANCSPVIQAHYRRTSMQSVRSTMEVAALSLLACEGSPPHG